MRRRIHEICSCGAELEYTGDFPHEVAAVAKQWRDDHRHELIGTETIYSGGEVE